MPMIQLHPIPGWLPNNSRVVTYNLQDGQLELEFDSSAAQLVYLFITYGTAGKQYSAISLYELFFKASSLARSIFVMLIILCFC